VAAGLPGTAGDIGLTPDAGRVAGLTAPGRVAGRTGGLVVTGRVPGEGVSTVATTASARACWPAAAEP